MDEQAPAMDCSDPARWAAETLRSHVLQRGVFVAVGANLGDPRAQIEEALGRFGRPGTRVLRCARIHRTLPVGQGSQPTYLNTVFEAETDLSPIDLLDWMLAVEHAMGRVRTGTRWSARRIDLDLVLYRDLQLCRPRLRLPHPELTRRSFVLAPLSELAPHRLVPGTGRTVQAHLWRLMSAGGRPEPPCQVDAAAPASASASSGCEAPRLVDAAKGLRWSAAPESAAAGRPAARGGPLCGVGALPSPPEHLPHAWPGPPVVDARAKSWRGEPPRLAGALTDVVSLTRALVEVPSVTGAEGALCRAVAERLAEEGFTVSTQIVPPEPEPEPPDPLQLLGAAGGPSSPNPSRKSPDDPSPRAPDPSTKPPNPSPEPSFELEAKTWPRLNVLARTDPGPVRVLFTTHLDTVPPFLPPAEDDLWLHGRGSCDAKGAFAAQWIALRRLRDEGRRGVGLLGVVGEETRSMGAKAVRGLLDHADFIIDGEPTDLELARAAKGVLLLEVSADGVAAHSAYPERGRSAVHGLIEALHALCTAQLPAQENFGPTTVNVGRISGGVAPNVVSPFATAVVMLRLGAPSTVVEARVREILGEILGDGVRVEVTSRAEPHQMHIPPGRQGILVRFGSDVPHLSSLGTPLLVGPGSIHDAHTAHERVRKSELQAAVQLYTDLARSLLGDERVR